DRLLIDERAVGAVQVVKDEPVLFLGDLGVLPRDPRIVDDDVVQGRPAHEARRLEDKPLAQEVTVERQQPPHGRVLYRGTRRNWAWSVKHLCFRVIATPRCQVRTATDNQDVNRDARLGFGSVLAGVVVALAIGSALVGLGGGIAASSNGDPFT